MCYKHMESVLVSFRLEHHSPLTINVTKNIMYDPLIRFIQGTLHTLHNFMLLRDGCFIQNLCFS